MVDSDITELEGVLYPARNQWGSAMREFEAPSSPLLTPSETYIVEKPSSPPRMQVG